MFINKIMQLSKLKFIESGRAACRTNAIETGQTMSMKVGDPFIDAITTDLEEERNLSTGMAILEMSERQQPDTSSCIISFSLGKG